MSLLTLNGVEFPLVQCDAEPVRAGAVERASSLAVRDGVRARAYNLTCAVSLLEQPLARAVRGLVEGAGLVLPFTSVLTPASWAWSSRGDVPTLNDFGQSTPGRYGDHCATNPGGNTLEYRVAWSEGWTALAWVGNRDGAPAWQHLLHRSDAASWRNGVLQEEDDSGWVATYPAEDGSRRLRLGDYSGAGDRWSDVVFLPYLVPDDWAPLLYAFHSRGPWPSLPYVLAEGAALEGGSALVQGVVDGVQRTVGSTPGTWRESFAFTLQAEP